MYRASGGGPVRRVLPIGLFLSCLVVLTGASCSGGGDGTTPIGSVQGHGHASALVGTDVTVGGVVTAVLEEGFVLQDSGDGDDATSDALIVRAEDPDRFAGTQVIVTGTVSEEIPGGRDTNLSTTTLIDATIVIRGSDVPAPTPVVLGEKGRPIPDRTIDDGDLSTYDAAVHGLDFYESLESMLVRVDGGYVISSTSGYGELWILADGGRGASGRNARGGVTLTADDANPERIQVEDDLFEGRMPKLAVGDRLEAFVGIVSYGFGNYEILPLERVGYARLEARPVIAPQPPADGALTVATFNILNLGGDEDAQAFNARARVIVESLHAPALVALQEVQDDDGADGRDDPSASGTFAKLIDAIERVGGPRYDFAQIDPVNGADGGEPGGNIRVGYLFDPTRIELVRRGNAGPTDATAVERIDGAPRLALSPGFVQPRHASFERSRKPLAAEFRWDGRSLFVVNVHFSSKGGSTPLYGATRPPVNGNEAKRAEQAGVVRELVETLVETDADARVIVLGDFNEFDWNPALQRLTQGGPLRNLMLDLPAVERATYIYEGNAQALDHVLVTGFGTTTIEAVHACTGRVDPASDHDPVLVRLR